LKNTCTSTDTADKISGEKKKCEGYDSCAGAQKKDNGSTSHHSAFAQICRANQAHRDALKRIQDEEGS
jgi:hypothetical protein